MNSLQDYPILGEPGDESDFESEPALEELEAEYEAVKSWENRQWAEQEAINQKISEREHSLQVAEGDAGYGYDEAEYAIACEEDEYLNSLSDDEYWERVAEIEWHG